MALRVLPEGLSTASAAIETLTARLAAAHAAVAAQGAEEHGRSGVGVAGSGASYATGHTAAASSYLRASL